MNDNGPLVSVEQLTVAIPARRGGGYAVRDLSLRLEAGQAVGIVGESGSGKSMTARALLGLLPPGVTVTGGTVRVDSQDVLSMRPRDRAAFCARTFGYVPQDPLATLNPVLTVGEQITESGRLRRGAAGRRQAAKEILRGYGLRPGQSREQQEAASLLAMARISEPQSRARQYPHQFSGGMRQRAIIAAALAGRPRLLIADEPTTALDASVERQVLDLLLELRRDAGTALLLISHDLNVVAVTCEYVYVLYGGRLLEEGPTQSVLRRPRSPYTASLLAATPSFEAPTHDIQRHSGTRTPGSDGCPFATTCPRVIAQCPTDFPPATMADDEEHRFWCHNPLPTS